MNAAGTDVLHIGWVDLALLGLLLVSVIVGLLRGLAYEVMSLLGWVVAFVAAQALGPELAPHLPVGAEGSALNAIAGVVAVFFAVLVGWSVLSWLVKKLIQASPLSPLDRLLGGVFGVLRGVLIALVVTLVVGMTSLAESSTWQTSRGAAGLQALLIEIKPLLPEPVARHLRAAEAAVRSERRPPA